MGIKYSWGSLLLMPSKYYIIMGVMAALDFYMTFDFYKLVTCRGDKFYDHEAIYAYFCIYTDIIFSIPFDRTKK